MDWLDIGGVFIYAGKKASATGRPARSGAAGARCVAFSSARMLRRNLPHYSPLPRNRHTKSLKASMQLPRHVCMSASAACGSTDSPLFAPAQSILDASASPTTFPTVPVLSSPRERTENALVGNMTLRTPRASAVLLKPSVPAVRAAIRGAWATGVPWSRMHGALRPLRHPPSAWTWSFLAGWFPAQIRRRWAGTRGTSVP